MAQQVQRMTPGHGSSMHMMFCVDGFVPEFLGDLATSQEPQLPQRNMAQGRLGTLQTAGQTGKAGHPTDSTAMTLFPNLSVALVELSKKVQHPNAGVLTRHRIGTPVNHA